MTPEYKAAIHAARLAGNLLRLNFNQAHLVHFKSAMEIVTEMDQKSEKLIAETLQSSFPDYGYLGEEGIQTGSPDQKRWIVDPLDGTTNYARGYPLFGVSVALATGNQVVLGVVYNPILNELFVAEKDRGATLNGSPIRVSPTRELSKSLLASGFPYDAWTTSRDNLKEWEFFTKRALSVRCDGAAALDLCHVAMGRLDGFWELDLEPWDIAAGALIVQEAGGKVTDVRGNSLIPYQKNVLATNGQLHKAMLAILSPDEEVHSNE